MVWCFMDEATQPKSRSSDRREVILASIDEGLSIFGDVKPAIYYHLEKAFRIKQQEIPEEIEEFLKALNRLFGLGAKVIENSILRSLSCNFNIDLEELSRTGLVRFVTDTQEIKGKTRSETKNSECWT